MAEAVPRLETASRASIYGPLSRFNSSADRTEKTRIFAELRYENWWFWGDFGYIKGPFYAYPDTKISDPRKPVLFRADPRSISEIARSASVELVAVFSCVLCLSWSDLEDFNHEQHEQHE